MTLWDFMYEHPLYAAAWFFLGAVVVGKIVSLVKVNINIRLQRGAIVGEEEAR